MLENFEEYAPADGVPASWFNYGNAGGGVSVVAVGDPRSYGGQATDNQVLAWGFDATRDPGYGGVGKEFARPVDWSEYEGIQFRLFGSGEGGQLQVEIGEDLTSDVERYRSYTFRDNTPGWRLIRIPFAAFGPAAWNPVPGNGRLDLLSVENIVFAANAGASVMGIAIDDLAVYGDSGDSSPVTSVPPSNSDGEIQLVWSDEFNGTTIDRSNWRFDIGGWGWGNGESQYYTDRLENARVENGALVIEARRENFGGSEYTSARLLSQGLREFQYGRIEARVKVPAGVGTWPAFWMLGTGFGQDPSRTWPDVGEIDIMEYVGREPSSVIGALHGPGYSGANGLATRAPQNFRIADDWHVFAVEWDATGISWFIDGSQFARVTPGDVAGGWVFDQPFFLILNLALGGTLGGSIDPELEFPLRYLVDYVRVYQ